MGELVVGEPVGEDVGGHVGEDVLRLQRLHSNTQSQVESTPNSFENRCCLIEAARIKHTSKLCRFLCTSTRIA